MASEAMRTLSYLDNSREKKTTKLSLHNRLTEKDFLIHLHLAIKTELQLDAIYIKNKALKFDYNVNIVFEYLLTQKNLKTLKLSLARESGSINAERAKILVEIINNNNITRLDISKNTFEPGALKYILSNINAEKMLESISLNGCMIDDEFIKTNVKLLARITKGISLQKNLITLLGLGHILKYGFSEVNLLDNSLDKNKASYETEHFKSAKADDYPQLTLDFNGRYKECVSSIIDNRPNIITKDSHASAENLLKDMVTFSQEHPEFPKSRKKPEKEQEIESPKQEADSPEQEFEPTKQTLKLEEMEEVLEYGEEFFTMVRNIIRQIGAEEKTFKFAALTKCNKIMVSNDIEDVVSYWLEDYQLLNLCLDEAKLTSHEINEMCTTLEKHPELNINGHKCTQDDLKEYIEARHAAESKPKPKLKP